MPFITLDDLLAHPNIYHLTRYVKQTDIIEAYTYPMLFFRRHVCVGYGSSVYWSVEEAISLATGLDPFYFILRPEDYTLKTCTRRKAISEHVQQAIKSNELTVAMRDGCLSVQPLHFCTLTLEPTLADLTSPEMLIFFREIELTPNASSMHDGDVPSPLWSAGG
jgi:hypothetical protein